ncbi:hypothetical protein [Phaeobacter sp.]|uniref:hypothetical protein n=1 Tax=Phaeobacter sp. TaxID=1902409 RepID=UPI0025D8AE49|nr:hypothetical protein [Phaeobacter sp.]
MTKQLLLRAALCAALGATFMPASATAGAIEKACRQSDRTAASPSLCRCIQSVADASLNRSERRTVSKWFSEPDRAQDVRQSDRRSDERLWARYKAFGETASRVCG